MSKYCKDESKAGVNKSNSFDSIMLSSDTVYTNAVDPDIDINGQTKLIITSFVSLVGMYMMSAVTPRIPTHSGVI